MDCHTVLYLFRGSLFTLNCMTQPLSGTMSCVTAYTSLPSALPQTITPSGELQNLCTEQSSENNQCSLTEETQAQIIRNTGHWAGKQQLAGMVEWRI